MGLNRSGARSKGQHASRRNVTWQVPGPAKIPYVAAQRRYGPRVGIMGVGVRERSHQKMQGICTYVGKGKGNVMVPKMPVQYKKRNTKNMIDTGQKSSGLILECTMTLSPFYPYQTFFFWYKSCFRSAREFVSSKLIMQWVYSRG